MRSLGLWCNRQGGGAVMTTWLAMRLTGCLRLSEVDMQEWGNDEYLLISGQILIRKSIQNVIEIKLHSHTSHSMVTAIAGNLSKIRLLPWPDA